MRAPHILQHNKSNETVQHAIWFDTETKPRDVNSTTISHELWFGWATYCRRLKDGKWSKPDWLRFESRPEFWKWVFEHTRPKTKLYMFCHNTSFDLPVLDTFASMSKAGYILKSAVLESPPTVLVYRLDTKTITIVDTLNIWRCSLAELGKQIGLPKLEMPGRTDSVEAWNTYGQRDTAIIMEACILWWKMLIELDFGGFAPTLAAQAMRTYRHKYMRHEILIDCHENALELTRAGYFGGRTEAHFIGQATGNFYLLDVNSMYPYIMSTERVPIRIIGYTRSASNHDLEQWLKTGCVVAQVTIRTPDSFAPYRADTKLLFPTGKFQTILASSELRYALDRGYIQQIHQVAVYDGAVAFKEYMDDVWNMRIAAILKGDNILAGQLKTLINAFYGKWGQSGAVWEKKWDVPTQEIEYWLEYDVESGETHKWRKFAGIVQKRSGAFESSNSFPAIASHITAAARMQLWSLMQFAGLENTFYCDTDSLLVNENGFQRLQDHINPGILGMLKIEGVYDHIRIWGCKDYVFGEKARLKGIRKNALKIGPNLYEQDRWVSLKGLLRQGIDNQALTTRIRKQLRRVYEKGIIQADGRVLPFYYF